MKENRIRHKGQARRAVLAVFVLTAVAAIVFTVVAAFNRLREAWLDQCEITDVAAQVTISDGVMAQPEVILEMAGIRPGANLATIDFRKRRDEILRRTPCLRSLEFSRRMPDRLRITFEERKPVAKMGVRGMRGTTGRVTDDEGVVFYCRRGTQLLPTIVESAKTSTPVGGRLPGNAAAALTLVAACRDNGASELTLLDIDASRKDDLAATLGNYHVLDIAWPGWNAPPTPKSRKALDSRLAKLVRAMRQAPAGGSIVWKITEDSEYVYANTQRILP